MKKWVTCLVSLFALVGSVRISAAPLPPLSVEEMAIQAEYIIEGTVLSIRSEWNADRTQIYSVVRIVVDRSLKDAFPESEITLRMLGGQIPEEDIGMLVPESPQLAEKESFVLFLHENLQTLFPVVGVSQGSFHLETDRQTGARRAQPQDGQALPVQELETRVQQALTR